MRKSYLTIAVVLALGASMTLQSCLGSFALSNKVLNWNRQVGDKFVNELVFVAFWILPVYEMSLLADILVINSIEFWSGENPVVAQTKVVDGKDAKYLVQSDKTGDRPLSESVKDYIKEKYAKPGAVFLGVVHRLDRPVSGLVVFARTSKALSRLNDMFRNGEVHKTYWAFVERRKENCVKGTDYVTLTNWLVRNEKQNKSYVVKGPQAHTGDTAGGPGKEFERTGTAGRPGKGSTVSGAKLARLRYHYLYSTERYHLMEVELLTGRHHQIRCQLAHLGCPIKGDLKYGAPRSNPDGGICLHAWNIRFIHPVKKEPVDITAPLPETWKGVK